MKLTIKHVTESSPLLSKIEALYKSAFPANERRPLMPLLRDRTGHGETVAFFDGDLFCGFACLLTDKDISHIIYFAVEDTLRGKGYGSAALSTMAQWKKDKRIIVDIEMEDAGKENNIQRRRRKQFYINNGFSETEISYTWRNETYEILSAGGNVSNNEFERFWEQICYDDSSLEIY